MAGLDKQKRGQLGVNVVEQIVISEWGSRWQAIDGFNDDGVDGLIFIERSSSHTGQIIHVQVKCTDKKPNSRGLITIAESETRLRKHEQRWKRVVGASIVVHVHPETLEAHWTDLKRPASQTKTTIGISQSSPFNRKSKKEISRLCGTIHRDVQLPVAAASSKNFAYLVVVAGSPSPPGNITERCLRGG